MESYCYLVPKRRGRNLSLVVLAFVLAIVNAGRLPAQDLTVVGTPYVTGEVVTNASSAYGGGRFNINAGPFYGSYRFLYNLTSHVVFRVNTQSGVFYYTNSKNVVGEQPSPDGVTPVPYRAFDSTYLNVDTVGVIWKNMNGYTVEMRLYPEQALTPYDRGGDIIVEFKYSFLPFAPAADLGIFMMLDTYNGQAEGAGGGGDKSSVMTTRGYFPSDGPGKVFQLPFEPIPEFYHVGNFLYQTPLNTVLPVHRLLGKSHSGLPLTDPELFAIGNWRKLRFLAWDIDLGGLNISDCATITRWGGLRGNGMIRTAFGMNDKEGNNIFHCRDQRVFVDIRTERVIEQKSKDGAYSPAQFNVELWITNTSDLATTATVTFNTPIGAPRNTGRLSIDPSTPAAQVATLAIRETKKMLWKVNLAPSTNDSLIDIPLDFRFQLSGTTGGPRVFRLPCTPIITIKGFREPQTPVDTMAPPIVRQGFTRRPDPLWRFQTFDRHLGYIYDTGLDRIVVERNDNANFVFGYQPINFTRCDTTRTVDMTARVVDTTKAGYIVFAVYDCRGNVTRDSAIYNPRPDIFKPELVRSDSSGSYGPPCNTRTFSFYLVDSLNQTPTAGDVGFGSITVLGPLDNFTSLDVNFDRGNAPIRDFDPRVSFRLSVVDTMFDARATIRVSDYAQNDDTFEVRYCTLPDDQAPRAVVVPTPNPDPSQGPKVWTVYASDTLAWDRGLESVVVLDSSNVNFTPPLIAPGDDTASFMVSVIKDSMDARITVEIRDRYYAAIPEGHADTVTLRFAKIPDTLAPNIVYTPTPGSNGAIVDVEVNDIHYFGPTLYPYDRGLATITAVQLTSNLRLVSPPVFSAGDMMTTFRFEVIDTLALTKYDTICVEAVDLYGNTSSSCYLYPLRPDTLSPILTASLDDARTVFTGTVSDSRQYDRGLGSVTVENPVNIEPGDVNVLGLNGAPSQAISMRVVDPAKPISGTFVVRDLIAEREQTSETEAVHGVRIPFQLPVVSLDLITPATIEDGQEVRAKIVATNDFSGSLVRKIDFTATYVGDADYKGVQSAGATMVAGDNNGVLGVVIQLAPTTLYTAGTVLGEIVFTARGGNAVGLFVLAVDRSTLKINDDIGDTYTVQKPGDTAISLLKLPPPRATLLADSATYVNGICERILGGRTTGSGKVNGLAILGMLPHPASAGSGSVISLDVRDLPHDGATVELLSSRGEVLLRMPVVGSGDRITRLPVQLPRGTASGLYVVRLRAGGEVAVAKMIIAD